MHNTEVITKDGEKFIGPIWYWRPCFNYFTIKDGAFERRFCFDDIESAVTKGERTSIMSPLKGNTVDEMERAKKDLDMGRKHKWNQDGVPYPVSHFNWEKKYET